MNRRDMLKALGMGGAAVVAAGAAERPAEASEEKPAAGVAAPPDVLIALLLDRSGSMDVVRQPTIEAFNRFIEGQRQVPGTALVSLFQFDDQFEVVYENADIATAPLLTEETFVPRGWTALYDAVTRTIGRIEEAVRAMAPQRVIVVIQTDGAENASHEATREAVLSRISEKREKAGWQFVFLGANQDAFQAALTIGISADATKQYYATATGVQTCASSLCCAVTAYRTDAAGNSAGFFRRDNAQAKTDGR